MTRKWLAAVAIALVVSGDVVPTADYRALRTVAAFTDLPAAAGRFWGVPLSSDSGRESRPSIAQMADALSTLAAATDDAGRRRQGVAEVLMGRLDLGFAILNEAVSVSPRSAAAWADLSAAHLYVAGRSELRSRALVTALESAQRSLDLADSPEAWFNYGLASMHLGLTSAASTAFGRAVDLDPLGYWALSTRGLRAALRRPPIAPRDVLAELRAVVEVGGDLPAVVGRVLASSAQGSREAAFEAVIPLWFASEHQGNHSLAQRWRAVLEVMGDRFAGRGDSLLASCVDSLGAAGHLSGASSPYEQYLKGMASFRQGRHNSALLELTAASRGLSRFGSPCRVLSDLQLAVAIRQVHGPTAARPLVDRAVRLADSLGAPSARARGEVVRAMLANALGRSDEAAEAYRTASEAYRRMGERYNACAAARGGADSHRLLGEQMEAWRLVDLSMDCLGDDADPLRRYLHLFEASLLAADEGLPRAALALQTGAVEAAHERGVPAMLGESLTRRARLHIAGGHFHLALTDLEQAAAQPTDSVPYREYNAAWSAFVQAELLVSTGNAHGADSLLSPRLFEYFSTNYPGELPSLFLVKGRSLAAVGKKTEAEEAWNEGIAWVERRLSGLTQDQQQVSYLDRIWDLYGAVVEARLDAGDDTGAFRTAERGRSTASRLFGASGDFTTSAPTEPGHAVLVFLALPTKLVRWSLSASGVSTVVSPHGAEEIARLATAFRESIRHGVEEARTRLMAQRLHTMLLAGVDGSTRSLTVVPDGPIASVPFAALVDPRSGRYLVEDRDVAFVTPAPIVRAPQTEAPLTAVILTGARDGDLPEAFHEAHEIHAIYAKDGARLLEGATPGQFARLAPDARVVHFAGHAVSHSIFPWRSHLKMAADSEHPDGRLVADEIALWDLGSTDVVVLASCDSLVTAHYRGDGLVGLARPFLKAGVRAVVGSFWPVEDRPSRSLLRELHRTSAAGALLPAAVRKAQLAALSSLDPTERLIRNWAAYGVIVSSAVNDAR